MAAHTPIASAIAASSQPSFAFSKLQDLSASYERLRGLQIDALTELDRINANMGVTVNWLRHHEVVDSL